MPSRHEKIREIVATVRRMRTVSLPNLVDAITAAVAAGRCPAFLFRTAPDDNGGVAHIPCKPATIRRQVRFCRELGLLVEEDEISLHPEIKDTRNAKALDLALGTRLLEYMERHAAGFDKLQEAIRSQKTTDPHSLFENIEPDGLSEEEFSSCLNLLAMVSQEIISFQRKQYVLENA
jgi:hypothetical protein